MFTVSQSVFAHNVLPARCMYQEELSPLQEDSSCSRQHAAIVHHRDGRLFVIDLQSVCCHPSYFAEGSAQCTVAYDVLHGVMLGYVIPVSVQTQGTFLDSRRLQPNKPKQLIDGSVLTFGTSSLCYLVNCDSAGAPLQRALLLLLFPHQG